MSWESERGMVQRALELRPYAKILFLMRNAAMTLLILVGLLGQTLTADSRADFSGRWEGVQKIQSEMPEVVADVVFTIRQTGGQLSGEISFAGRARNSLKPKSKWCRPTSLAARSCLRGWKARCLHLAWHSEPARARTKPHTIEWIFIGQNRAILQPAEQLLIDMSADMRRKIGK
jgi:hypothetical protein